MEHNKKTITIGSRGSDLALWQARFIKSRLEELQPKLLFIIEIIKTTGDKIIDSPLSVIGGKGAFTQELETALLAGEIDLAVHSLKDLPTEVPEGLAIACIPERAQVEDAFLSKDKSAKLFELPHGAIIATGSLRRKAHVLAIRPDYKIVDIRGNVPTRIKKLNESNWDGMILASAGLYRLRLENEIAHIIRTEDMLSAPGQGALAIEIRAEDKFISDILTPLEHKPTKLSVETERHILKLLGGGCQMPLGTYVRSVGDKYMIEASIASPSGEGLLRTSTSSSEADLMSNASSVADYLLNHGATEIIASLNESERSPQ